MTAASEQQLLAFRVAGQRFALPSAAVREVARLPRLTRVPHAPDALLGLGNFRGAALPVLSFAALVDRPRTDKGRVILIDGDDPVGLLVDDVQGMVDSAEMTAVEIQALLRACFTQSGTRRVKAVTAVSAAARDEIVSATRTTLVAFAVSDQSFALPLEQVDQVIPLPADIALMPHADAVVLGTAAFGDTLLPLLSLRALLALDREAPATRPRVLIVQIGQHRVGLVVDAMIGVLRVEEAQIDAVPAVLTRGGAEARIQAICRLDQGRRLVSVLAAKQLLRDDIVARLGDTREGQAMAAQDDGATEQFLVFRIGDDEFGLPIDAVDEVARLPAKLARLPKAPAFVMGAMNLRGSVVPVIDQSMRFAGTPAAGARRRVVIVSIDKLQAGFLVDSATEVLRVPVAAVRPAPELGNEGTRVFERVANLAEAGRMILIVSPRELLDRAERALLEKIPEGSATAS